MSLSALKSRGMLWGLVMLAVSVVLAGCEGDPTPLPVHLPTAPTETPPPESLSPLRYVLLPNVAGHVPAEDWALIEASGVEVVQVSDTTAEIPAYDVRVQYGIAEGWTASEMMLHVSLALALDADRAAVVQAALNPADGVAAAGVAGVSPAPLVPVDSAELRTRLANLGYPDGFGVVMGVASAWGSAPLYAQLRAANIDVQPVVMTTAQAFEALQAGKIQAVLIAWAQPESRDQWTAAFGAAQVIDLYTVPISYQVADGLTVSFTPHGFPLIARR